VGAVGALGEASGGRLLDVGCGDGELCELMIRRGWRVLGIEPSEAAAERAGERGVEVAVGTLKTVELEPGAQDAIVFNHSLEHVEDPVEALVAAREGLRADGLVAVSTPNFDCWARRRFGRSWFHLDLPRHRVHFTEGALRTALERAGLRPQRTWTSSSPSGLAGSIQYRRLGGLAVDEGPSRHAIGQIAALGLIPVARAEQALGGGRDFLHALARRQGPTLPDPQ
jgi:SAM-dependent methyltransferase